MDTEMDFAAARTYFYCSLTACNYSRNNRQIFSENLNLSECIQPLLASGFVVEQNGADK